MSVIMLSEKHYRTAYNKVCSIAMLAWFTWYIARLIYYCHLAKKLYKRQCYEKGIDWKIEGRRGERQFLRAIGLKFLIKKQYRDLDE